jgi:hypothetical protein
MPSRQVSASKPVPRFPYHFCDAEVFKCLLEIISDVDAYEKRMCDIADNVVDVYQGVSLYDSGASVKSMFGLFPLLMPHYLKLLKNSIDRSGSEDTIDYFDLGAVINLDMVDAKRYFPKVRRSDGTMGYALLQVAAMQAGISDDYVSYWHILIGGLAVSLKNEFGATLN